MEDIKIMIQDTISVHFVKEGVRPVKQTLLHVYHAYLHMFLMEQIVYLRVLRHTTPKQVYVHPVIPIVKHVLLQHLIV